MNSWKITFFITFIFFGIFIALQQYGISELKRENQEYVYIIKNIEKDLDSIVKGPISGLKKEFIINKLKKNDPELELFEYDLGEVKMRGLDLFFNTSQEITAIKVKVY